MEEHCATTATLHASLGGSAVGQAGSACTLASIAIFAKGCFISVNTLTISSSRPAQDPYQADAPTRKMPHSLLEWLQDGAERCSRVGHDRADQLLLPD
jgi:hypothetical protein